MSSESYVAGPPESEWVNLKAVTSGRMEAIWVYAKDQGYTNLKDFWEAMHAQGWGYYDVIKTESPE